MKPRSPSSVLLVVVLAVLGGLAAGIAAASGRLPEPRPGELAVQDREFRFDRSGEGDEPMLITPERWLSLPELRGDFDLAAQLEMGVGAELDIVLRRVDPRELQRMTLPMQGRFRVLRLSTVASSEPWRDEESALFGPGGGLKLAAGSPATIQVEARGRSLEAIVAGKRLPVFQSADAYGAMAWIVRGGPVSLRSLTLIPRSVRSTVPTWGVGLAAGLLVAFVSVWLAVGPVRVAVAALCLALGAAAASRDAFSLLPPLAMPEAASEGLVCVVGLPLALALLAQKWIKAWVVMGLVAGGALASLPHRLESARFPPLPRIDEVFGEVAGDQPLAALAQRIPGALAIHTLDAKRRRVFLLGGQLLYQRGAGPTDHVETQLLAALRESGADVDVVALPTIDGWTRQQWSLFHGFYQQFAPEVLVFGLPRDEDATVVDAQGRQAPRSTAEGLREVLDEVHGWCGENGTRLVLLADPDAPAALVDVLESAAASWEDVALVSPPPAAQPAGFAAALARVVAPLLGR